MGGAPGGFGDGGGGVEWGLPPGSMCVRFVLVSGRIIRYVTVPYTIDTIR